MAGAGSAGGGFKAIDSLVNPPKVFPGAAAHSQLDGRVQKVAPAPQGGAFVTIINKDHYLAPGHTATVKPADEVEAGDQLSDGLPNPNERVAHKC